LLSFLTSRGVEKIAGLPYLTSTSVTPFPTQSVKGRVSVCVGERSAGGIGGY